MVNRTKFQYFISILFSDKYIKIYSKESGFYFHAFHACLFLVQWISYGLFIKILSTYYKLQIGVDGWEVISYLAGFMILKVLIEKFIASIFNLHKLIDQYHFYKYGYQNFIGVLLIPFIAFLQYNPLKQSIALYITIGVFGALYLFTWVLILKNYRKLIVNEPLYFILYFCGLEIAPYLWIAKWLFL